MTSNVESAYKELLSKFKDIMVLSTAQGIIHWDMETMMPPKAVEQRSQQLALLSRLHHKLATDPDIGKLLKTIQTSLDYESMGQVEKRNLYLINKSYQEQTALPERLVSELSMQEAITVNLWKKAKAKKDFNLYKADLKKLLDLSKQAAEILMKVKETKTPYEALIDNFEPKMPAQTITETFNQLLAGLKPLIAKIESCQTKPSTDILNCPVPVEEQRKIAQLITQMLGYDTVSAAACGRIDETEHPFTSGCYDDVRITTHYHPDNFSSSIFSVLHETGHAIYEKNLNQEWKYQPVGSTCSFGIHESQSRFYENIIGRSQEFWASFLPKIRQTSSALSNVELEPFVQAINRVERSKIRIEADEVTYSIHIIIRFELERDLFADKLNIDELPQAWNQKYADYLDVKIQNDSEGVMQDTHWASGLYGYFPSYALGNIYSGQIRTALTKTAPNWLNQLSEGNLQTVNEWLKDNIHSKGDLYDPQELIKLATGQELDSQPFLQYLNEKYARLYGF
ncbi:MAG: carboxypeptidase M32 [Candidatus Bathyarchaeota archaeon]|nr:carboxypeptidase M32 [Candidatus Bathyarchaeota archaeon]